MHTVQNMCVLLRQTIWTMDIMKSPTTNINANDSSHLKGKENLFWADLNESGLGTWICSPNSMVQHGSSYTHCYSHRWRQVINQSVFFFFEHFWWKRHVGGYSKARKSSALDFRCYLMTSLAKLISSKSLTWWLLGQTKKVDAQWLLRKLKLGIIFPLDL